MGRLRLAAVECDYKELDRQLKEQFIYGLNDNDMIIGIIKELTKTEENKDDTSGQVLLWARQVGAQRAQTAVLSNLKVDRKSDAI